MVSWLPPDPPNGILTHYLVRVLMEPEGEELYNTSISVGVAQQLDVQSVTFSGLDLANVGYTVLVFANTSVGMGPSSDPIRIGAEVSTAVPTPEIATSAEATTSPETTDDTSTVETDDTTGTLLPQTTPTLGSEITESVSRDDVYYIIRIVPPVAGIFLLVAVVLVIVFCCLHRCLLVKKSKGRYQIQDSIKNQYK